MEAEQILPDVVDDGSKPDSFTLQEFQLAKWVGDLLFKTYPGHLWGINVQDGLLTIYNMAISANWGYVLREEDLVVGKGGRRLVIKGAGELLERYNLSRGKAQDNEYSDMIVDLRGEPIGDKS